MFSFTSSTSSSALASRWQSFSAVLLAVSICGTPYAFGIFSEIFKKELQFNQLDLSIIGSSGSTGLYSGVLCGLALERIGPKNLLICGGLFVLFGNFYIWLAVQRIVWGTVPMISLAYFLAQVGVACTTMTATPLSIQIFPSEVTGQVAGLSKAYFGISSAVLATISAGFFDSTSKDFILFVTFFIPCIQFSAARNANFLPQSLRSFNYEINQKRYHSLLPYIFHLVGLFILIIISSLVKRYLSSSSSSSPSSPSKITMTLSVILCCHLLTIIIFPSFYGPRWINDISLDETIGDADGTSHSTGYAVVGASSSGSHKSYMSLTTSTHSQINSEQLNEIENTQLSHDDDQPIMTGRANNSSSSSTTPMMQMINFQDDEKYQGEGDLELNPLTASSSSSLTTAVPSSYQPIESYHQSDGITASSSSCSSSSPALEFISFYNRHIHLQETITMWRCYGLMFIFMCLAGSGILVINNIQAVAQALHEEASPLFVTILSLSNACGRIFIGIVADYFQKSISRLQLLAIIALIMSTTQYLLSLGLLSLLYPSLLFVGFMFGATFSNIAAITSDIFGSKYIGSNYGFLDLAPAVGSYLFSTALIALFYPSQEGTCYGSQCFKIPFHITSLFCFLSCLLALVMNYYTQIIKK